jgi:hypothetical protein
MTRSGRTPANMSHSNELGVCGNGLVTVVVSVVLDVLVVSYRRRAPLEEGLLLESGDLGHPTTEDRIVGGPAWSEARNGAKWWDIAVCGDSVTVQIAINCFGLGTNDGTNWPTRSRVGHCGQYRSCRH